MTHVPAVGARLPRLEAVGKINGAAQYTDDIVRPFMLHGAVLGSPFAHAKILTYDVSRARQFSVPSNGRSGQG